MRAPLLLLVLIVAAAAGWYLLAGSEQLPPPPAVGDALPHDARPASAAPATERSPVAVERPAAPTAADPPVAASNPEATAGMPADAPTTVTLLVRDLATRGAVPAFRWRFRSAAIELRGEAVLGRADLALPGAAAGEVLVEADGFAPFVQANFTVPAPTAHPAVIDVFLRPDVPAAGITLLVHDTALQPIANVRVDAFSITDESRNGAWHLGQALWARATEATDGRYTLPPLPAGEYGIRVVATDAAGALLPLLPYVRTFALTGDNGFLEDVPLEPAALPVLELVDLAGNPLDPARAGTTTLRLHLTGAPPTSRRWVVATGAATTTEVDTLPGKGLVWPAEALPAGNYTLEVSVAGEVRVQQLLSLRAGERQVLRMVVP